jgi:hypothetical protein
MSKVEGNTNVGKLGNTSFTDNTIDDEMSPFGVVSAPNLSLLPKLSLIYRQNVANLQNAHANSKTNNKVEGNIKTNTNEWNIKTNTNGGGEKGKKNKTAKKLESKARK